MAKNDPQARAEECAKRIPQGGTLLEIGVWRGANTARVLKLRPDVSAVCVDPWAPAQGSYATSGSSDSKIDAAQWAQIHEIAKRNLAPYRGRVSLIKMRAEDFAPLRMKDTYDVIFIDGDHSYAGCSRDIAIWRSIAGKWIGGHDYGKASFPGVAKAVDEAFGEKGFVLGADSTWWAQSKGAVAL